MPFQINHAPISALLALGSIAGAGAARERKVARDMALINQMNAQNMQSEQANNQLLAADEANRISSALKYAELDQERGIAEQNRTAQTAAQQAARQIDMEQFNQRQGLDVRRQDFAEQQATQKQTENAAQNAAVSTYIDQIAPPGSPENQRLRLQFAANDRISTAAPQGPNTARNLNALKIIRDTLVDKYGEPMPGKEQQLQQVDTQIQGILSTMTAPQQGSTPPVTAVNPKTGQRIQYNAATGQWSPIQ